MITNIQTVSNDTLTQFIDDLSNSGKFTTQLTDGGDLVIIETVYNPTYSIVNNAPVFDAGTPTLTNIASFPAIDVPSEVAYCQARIALLNQLISSNAHLFKPAATPAA